MSSSKTSRWAALNATASTRESLRDLNPKLVVCSISGFGQDGPYAARAGYDFLIQGHGRGDDAHRRRRTGHRRKPAWRSPTSSRDSMPPTASQAALLRRAATGEGAWIDCALLDAQSFGAGLPGAQLPGLGAGGGAGSAMVTPNIVPYDVFPVMDGHIIIAAGNDGQFRKLVEILGRPDLATAPDSALSTKPGWPIATP